MPIRFTNTKIVVNSSTSSTVQVSLEKTGTSATTVSANILLSGADVLYPAAQQYNGLKFPVAWAAGETGVKTITISLEPTANVQEFIQATLDDILGDTIAEGRAYILISKSPVSNTSEKFLPTLAGNYVDTAIVGADGSITYAYKNPVEIISVFAPNTNGQIGKAGIVPAPPVSSELMVLTNNGWSDSLLKNYEQVLKTYIDIAISSLQQVFQTALNTLEQKLTNLFQAALDALEKKILKPGEVKIWPSSKLPTGYLWCRGQLVSRTQYAELFAEIGTVWGAGDGSTTFKLPTTEELFIRGVGANAALGLIGGSDAKTLAEANLPPHAHEIDPHDHIATFIGNPHTHIPVVSPHTHAASSSPHTHTGSVAPHSHNLPLLGEGDSGSNPGRDFDNTGTDQLVTDVAAPTISINSATVAVTLQSASVGVTLQSATISGEVGIADTELITQPSGNGVPFDIKPKFASFNFIIKY